MAQILYLKTRFNHFTKSGGDARYHIILSEVASDNSLAAC